jgi:2-hydroxy-6-oxonona-2,4-dienedioate hydrolase
MPKSTPYGSRLEAPLPACPSSIGVGTIISSRYMVPTAVELAPLCLVYAVDLPGYGDSVKPRAILGLSELADALAAWMDARRLGSAHLAANSFGCQVLAEFALRHVPRVDRLVLH